MAADDQGRTGPVRDPGDLRDVRSMLQRRRGQPGRIEKAKDPRKAFARLAGYLRPFRAGLSVVTVLVFAYSLLSLAGPRLLGLALDKAIAQRDIGQLPRYALAMLAAYLFSNLLQLLSNWLMAGISQRALGRLRGELFSHLQILPMASLDAQPSGSLMSRLTNDIDAIHQAVSQNLIALLSSALTMAGIIVAMFLLNPWLATASLVVVPLMAWFSAFIARYTRKGFRELQGRLGDISGIIEEAFAGQKLINAFGRRDSTVERFRAANEAVHDSAVRANSYAMLLMPLTGVLGNFFVVLLASLGGWLALRDLASIGIIATFINYGSNFTSPLRQLANLYNSIQAALAGGERVFELIDTPPESDPAGTAPGADSVISAVKLSPSPDSGTGISAATGAVRFDSITFAYPGGKPVIDNFSLEVDAGSTVALVGPTGAGKTTIINLLMRFYDPQEGTIELDGTDIKTMSLRALRQKIGIVLQDTFLFADTVMENIRFGRPDARDEECIEAAKLTEADHFIRQLPEGYATNLSERAGNLSQGQRQLLSITRVILADPSILVLDEATSSVDTRTELRIQKALLRLMEGRTSFVIAHRLSTIRDADLVAVIDKGRIAEQGSHGHLLEMKGLYHRLYRSQFKGNEI
jgi:ATP-binding cassette subfamily B protein